MKDKEKYIDNSWRAKMVENGIYKDSEITSEEKQIEEMAKDLKDCIIYSPKRDEYNHYILDYNTIVKRLVEKGWIKLNEDTVMLSRKEYEKLNMKYISALEQLENKSTETAEKILNKCDEFYHKYVSADFAFNVFTKWLKEEFGVEIKEN